MSYDIAIIGGGPGGYAAALRAAELNLKVAIIEREKVGGTCLHRGCIPTTSLLQYASVLDDIKRSDKFGIKVEGVSYDWQGVQKTKGVAVNRLFMGLKTLLKQRKVEVINGIGRFSEPGVVSVEGNADVSAVRASHVIIATGSLPQTIPALQGDSSLAMNTDQALEIDGIPKSISIIGGGAYGVEFASLFRSFGSEVSIIEVAPRLLPRDDADISKYLERAFTKRGINVHTGARVEEARRKDGGIEIDISKEGERTTI
ncbi:MAG TPA: FAD-dependent oxidoreductase, partial [Anaerolineae bacterium]|nr:FAD-dependent oxidoreductase [Anaerolineae bacterium]